MVEKIKKVGGNARNARVTHPKRQARRERAVDRLLDALERSTEDQLRIITERPGNSAREVLRLTGGETKDASVALELLRAG